MFPKRSMNQPVLIVIQPSHAHSRLGVGVCIWAELNILFLAVHCQSMAASYTPAVVVHEGCSSTALDGMCLVHVWDERHKINVSLLAMTLSLHKYRLCTQSVLSEDIYVSTPGLGLLIRLLNTDIQWQMIELLLLIYWTRGSDPIDFTSTASPTALACSSDWFTFFFRSWRILVCVVVHLGSLRDRSLLHLNWRLIMKALAF